MAFNNKTDYSISKGDRGDVGDERRDQTDAVGEAFGEETDATGEDAKDQTDSRGQARVPQMSKADFDSDRYKMNHPNRGKAIIFNNKSFLPRTEMGERTGSDVDADAMHELLDKLRFEDISRYDDQTVNDMKAILNKVAAEDHTDNDCFVCVILSHGDEGYIYGKDDRVPVDELVEPFKGHRCTSLAGKPKLFFVQACRGAALDEGITVSDAGGEGEEAAGEEIIRRIPTEADFLMAYSVVPGYYAWRNTRNGSWFIQAIYDVISKNWQKMDLLTMMTRVNKKVAYDFESNAPLEFMSRKKQIPCITSMLTKDVYFA